MPPCVHPAWAERGERWLLSMHVMGNARGKHLIIFAETKLLLFWFFLRHFRFGKHAIPIVIVA